MTANDQHQPASSRAIAALATTGRFLRWSKPAQRVCSRWLAAWARVRAVGVAVSPAAAQIAAGTVRGAVMPGRLDQQAAGVAVAGLGDPALGPGGPAYLGLVPCEYTSGAGDHRIQGHLVGQRQGRVVEPLSAQPQLVLARPRLPAVIDDPLPQQ